MLPNVKRQQAKAVWFSPVCSCAQTSCMASGVDAPCRQSSNASISGCKLHKHATQQKISKDRACGLRHILVDRQTDGPS